MMGTTPNLLLPLLSEGQAQKEITVNTAHQYLDGFVSGYQPISVAGGVHITLTEAQMRNMTLTFTGVLTANINVIIPARERFLIAINQTTGGFTLTMKTATGVGVSLPAGKSSLIVCDGTTTIALSLDAVASVPVPLTIPNSATPSPVANATVVSAQDTGGVDGKSGLLITSEDGTQHVLGNFVGLGTTLPEQSVHVVSANGVQATSLLESHIASTSGSSFRGRHSRGTKATPSYTLSGDVLSAVDAQPWARDATNTTDQWLTSGRLRFLTDSVDAQNRVGAKVEVQLMPGGSAAIQTAITVTEAGNFLLGVDSFGAGLTKGLVIGSGTSATPLADQVSLTVQDTAGAAAKAGLLVSSEDGTQHIFGDKVGVGITTGMTAMLHVRGPDGGTSDVTAESFRASSAGPTFRGKHARGTVAAPTVLAVADTTVILTGEGFVRNAADTANEHTVLGSVRIGVDSLDAQNRAGGRIDFRVSPGVSATQINAMRISEAGYLAIGNGFVTPTNVLHIQNTSLTTGQISLSSTRSAIVSGNVLGGMEFLSNDTNLTAPGVLTAALRAVATQTHTASVLGTSMQFFTTPAGTIVPINAFTMTEAGNFLLGSTTHGTGITKGLVLAQGTAPSTFPTDQVSLSVQDTDAVAGKSGLLLSTEDGSQHIFGHIVGLGIISGFATETRLQVRGADGAHGGITAESFIAATSALIIRGRHARGTAAARTVLNVNDAAMSVQGEGWGRNAANSADDWISLGRAVWSVESKDAQNRLGGFLSIETSSGVSATPTEKWRLTESGQIRSGIGPNGQYRLDGVLTELVTIAAAAFTDTAMVVPANSVVYGVSTRVVVAIPTATTVDVGVPGGTQRYVNNLSTALNTTHPGVDDGPRPYTTETAIRLTPDVTPATNAGRVRVTIYYYTLVAPTS